MEPPTVDHPTFGERLRALRLAAGLTQKALGGERFSHAYISSLETGRRNPSAAAVLFLSERLGREVMDSLVAGDVDLRVAMDDLPTDRAAVLRILDRVLECVQDRGGPLLKADILRLVGELHIADRDDLAEKLLDKAAGIFRALGGPGVREPLGRSLYLLGKIAERYDQPQAAAAYFREAAALFYD